MPNEGAGAPERIEEELSVRTLVSLDRMAHGFVTDVDATNLRFFIDHIASLSAQLAQVQAERDEARRDVVRMTQSLIGAKCEHHKLSSVELERLALRECPICWKACAVQMEAERDALSARLARVTALPEQWRKRANEITSDREVMRDDRVMARSLRERADQLLAALSPSAAPSQETK